MSSLFEFPNALCITNGMGKVDEEKVPIMGAGSEPKRGCTPARGCGVEMGAIFGQKPAQPAEATAENFSAYDHPDDMKPRFSQKG